MSFNVNVTSDFAKAAKRLNKKYPSFKKDYADFLESIKKDPLQGVELYPGIRKIRLQIKSKGKGKSGGARVITFNVLVDNTSGDVYLLLLYDKEDASTVDVKVVRELIHEMGLDGGNPSETNKWSPI